MPYVIKKIIRILKIRVQKYAQIIVEFAIAAFHLDSRQIYYNANGILKCSKNDSGENWFLTNILANLFDDISAPVILDVGANIGSYSLLLARVFPSSRCYSLEPNPIAFDQLCDNLKNHKNVFPLNIGAGSSHRYSEIFVYRNERTTSHASLYHNVLTELHRTSDVLVEPINCHIDSIDNMIKLSLIPENVVHFIKIDTEGHELECVRGAIDTIRSKGVRAIQFEFNEMNVASRTFLKDFYDILGSDWSFHRLDTKQLIPLGAYDSINEIYKFHNIVALRSIPS